MVHSKTLAWFSITLCYNSVPGSFGTIQSQTGICCHAMGQCRYVHLFHGLNSTSISCDLNQKRTHASVPWSEQSCDLNMILISELNVILTVCWLQRSIWVIVTGSSVFHVFSLVIWTHRDMTLHLPFNTIWFLLEANLNLDIGTYCRYIPPRQNQQPMNIKWWWNIDFNLLNFPAGWDCHSGNCLSNVDVQLLLSSGQPGTTVHVHWVHGGTLIIIMQ